MFCYCAESRRVARILTARYDQHLAASGLSSAQFELLNVIASKVRGNGRDLAEALAVDRTTLSRNLKLLLAEKLVRAQASRDDARQVLYSVTGGGKRRLRAAMPLWRAAHRQTLKELGSHSDAVRDVLQMASAELRG